MIRIEPAGAEALLLVLAEQPDAELPQRIARLAERIAQQLGPVLVDLVPAWTSLLVHYDLLRISHPQLVQQLTPLLAALSRARVASRASAVACSLSPASTAVLNLRTDVFSEDLTALLRWRAFSLVRLRLICDLMFATGQPSRLVVLDDGRWCGVGADAPTDRQVSQRW